MGLEPTVGTCARYHRRSAALQFGQFDGISRKNGKGIHPGFRRLNTHHRQRRQRKKKPAPQGITATTNRIETPTPQSYDDGIANPPTTTMARAMVFRHHHLTSVGTPGGGASLIECVGSISVAESGTLYAYKFA